MSNSDRKNPEDGPNERKQQMEKGKGKKKKKGGLFRFFRKKSYLEIEEKHIVISGEVATDLENREKKLKKRFFCLKDNGDLVALKNSEDKTPIRILTLHEKSFCRTTFVRYGLKVYVSEDNCFFFAVDSSKTMMEWVGCMEQCGSIYQPKEYLPSAMELHYRNIPNWTRNECLQFMLDHDVIDEKVARNVVQTMNGSILLKIENMKGVGDIGIKSLGLRKKLLMFVETFQQESYVEIVCLSKIDRLAEDNLSLSQKWNQARIFSSPQRLMEEFMNPEKMIYGYSKSFGESDLDDSFSTPFPSRKESFIRLDTSDIVIEIEEKDTVDGIDHPMIKEVETEEEEDEGEEEEGESESEKKEISEEKKESIENLISEKRVLPIKLVVSDMVQSAGYRNLRQIISPILRNLDYFKHIKEFGIFHSALIVGPWYLEWHDSSLMKPRSIYSKKALFCIDLSSQNELPLEEVCNRCAYVVSQWNGKMLFKRAKKEPFHGNCQDFIEDVIETLHLEKPSDDNFVGCALRRMVNRGKGVMEFVPGSAFREAVGCEKSYIFQSHHELDELVHKWKKVEDQFPEEFELLRCFDRAFWLRFLKTPAFRHNQQISSDKGGCPFGKPEFIEYGYPFPMRDRKRRASSRKFLTML